MPTTVQVDEKTLRDLEKLKLRLKLRSYNQVIQRLLYGVNRRQPSLFGALKGSRPFKREAEDEHF